MKIATGVDLIEIKRVQDVISRYGDHFLARVYTAAELAENGRNVASLAARFAAKEAVTKVLGCGIGRVGWQDIEILRGERGEPLLHLRGHAQTLAGQLSLNNWSLSLSHTHEHAVAMVVAISAG